MKISELTWTEATALVGLLRDLVQADDVYSKEEQGAIADVARQMGRREFNEAVARAREQFKTRSDLKAYLKTVDRKEARELIFEVALDVAEADGLTADEQKPLDWLASWWKLRAPG